MTLDLSAYLWLLIISAAITALLGLYAWEKRTMPGASPFIILMGISFVWSLANALEMAGTTLTGKLFWANTQYICYASLPLAWLVLILQFTGRERWLTRQRLALLSVIPVITVILVWTNDFHNLMRRNVFLDTTGPFPVVGKTYGPWAYVHIVYSYSILLAATFLLIETLLQAAPAFQGQPFVLLVGMVLPLMWNILYVTGFSPIKRHDIAPAVLSISGVVVAWGLFRYRLFDILPIAHDAVLISIRDGIIILDKKNQVVAINPAAQECLDWTPSKVVGKQAEEVFAPWPDMTSLIQEKRTLSTELKLSKGELESYFDFSLSPLLDQFGRSIGQLLILHDISDRKRVEDELRSLSLTDPLTGLSNRRKFFEVIEYEIERSRRYKSPLSLIMIDVNSLKTINDTFGHQAGDEVLSRAAAIIQGQRHTDLSARIGGDEFVLLMPATNLEGAEQLAVRLSEDVAKVVFRNGAHLGVSMGIAELTTEDDDHGETLLASADRAMYMAKQKGEGSAVAPRHTDP